LYEAGVKPDQAAFYLGWLAEEDGQIDPAMEWYAKVGRGETHSEARMRAARLIADQDLEAAREILQRLRGDASSQEEEVRIVQVEAGLLADHLDSDAVYAFYDQALERYPGDPELLYARAMYAVGIDDIHILEQDLRAILEQDPEHADALNALGYTLADRTDRYQEAHDYIQRAYQLNPESPAILDSMGWVLYRLGNLEEALEYLRKAYEMVEDGEIASHYGEVLWYSGEQEQARQVWDKAREAEPDNEYLRETLERINP
jgi:tetratricopeptide (TPR) repeat protein